MRRVVIESPFHADTAEELTANIAYAREALADSLGRGEAPFASHLLYPQVLDDHSPTERELGIAAGVAWGDLASRTVVYADRGISPGMEEGIAAAERAGRTIEYRRIKA